MNSKKFWTEGLGAYAVAILIALTIRWALLEAYVIPSGSMLPTLLINDHIFVNKFVYGVRVPFSKKWLLEFRRPERGEVIVFKYPKDESQFFIKRVIGLPGDKVFWQDGRLYINDEKQELTPPPTSKEFDYLRDADFVAGGGFGESKEDYAHYYEKTGDFNHSVLLNKIQLGGPSFGPFTVPENSLFVMGDNRDRSLDSRRWGTVPMENVLGKATFVWLSCEETLPVVSFLCNPLTIRWSRFFHQVHHD